MSLAIFSLVLGVIFLFGTLVMALWITRRHKSGG